MSYQPVAGSRTPLMESEVSTGAASLSNKVSISGSGIMLGQKHGGSKDIERASADVFCEEDLYDSVVVAAFGGVLVNLQKDETMIVHPFWNFIFCLPLFSVQMSSLLILRLSQRLDEDFDEHFLTETGESERMVEGSVVHQMKMVMIVVLQLLIFKELLGTLQVLVFLLNPGSWMDVFRPDPEEFKNLKRGKFFFSAAFLCPWAILATVLKLVVAYNVCIDSVSIVLACQTVRDCIYNSVAILFIADLDEVAWKVVEKIFHLCPFDDFEFFLYTEEEMKTFEVRAEEKKDWIEPLRKKFNDGTRHSIIRRGYGARRLEVVVVFSIIFLIYSRQIFVVLYAQHTRILPVARDVCTLWRWQEGKSAFFQKTAFAWTWFSKYFAIIDARSSINEIADPVGGGYCSEQYERMMMSDVKHIVDTRPEEVRIAFLCVIGFILLPQVGFVFNRNIRNWLERAGSGDDWNESEQASTADSGADTSAPAASTGAPSRPKRIHVQSEVRTLKERVASQEDEIQALKQEFERMKHEFGFSDPKKAFGTRKSNAVGLSSAAED